MKIIDKIIRKNKDKDNTEYSKEFSDNKDKSKNESKEDSTNENKESSKEETEKSNKNEKDTENQNKQEDSKQNNDKQQKNDNSKNKHQENEKDNKKQDNTNQNTDKNDQKQSSKQDENSSSDQSSDKGSPNDYLDKPIFSTVDENVKYLKKLQNESYDMITREMTLVNDLQTLKIGLAYYAGLVDQNLLNRAIAASLGPNFQNIKKILKTSEEKFDYFKNTLLLVIGVDDADKYGKLYNTLVNGDMILFIDGVKKCIIVGARLYQERSVDKPTTQISVKGSNDAFNENLLTNISLIRRRIKNPNLYVKNYVIGKESNTNMALLYINGLVDESLVKKVTERIESIKPHNIVDSSYIQSYLKEKQFTLFPTMYSTERPDSAVVNLLEGRLVLIIDASPYALVMPTLFIQLIHSSEDFYQPAIISSFFRLIRLLGLLMALFLPGIYVSLLIHHAELLPINLLFSLVGQRTQVPLPGFLELLLIMVVFDLLREAGTRMPTALGATLSFVGAIIIGQSSVEAGLISSIIVIIVALSGISALTIPNYDLNLTVTFLKYIATILAIILGFYGLAIFIVLTIIHLSSIRSFGVDYFTPFAPFSKTGLKDSVIRFPFKKLFKRKPKSSEQFPH